MPPPVVKKSYNWCFTLNNYDESDCDKLKESDAFKYLICGREVGESGTPHLQGYVSFKNQIRFNSAKAAFAMLSSAPHLEVAKGGIEANFKYCTKENNYFETGVRPAFQGEKGAKGRAAEIQRHEDAFQAAVAGDFDEIPADLRTRYYGTYQRINRDHQLAEEVKTLDHAEVANEWYWGETGTGKSLKARTENPDAYLKMCNKWWDGYNLQSCAIIEDFDAKHAVLIHHMKIWADIYPFLGEIKGGTIKIRPQKIIVTSNYHPRDIWSEDSDLKPILRRFRITKIVKI